jgi:hypothetical protein
MTDCTHSFALINIPGVPVGEGAACGTCGAEIRGTYAKLARIALAAHDYAADRQHTISSLSEYPKTQQARLDRRMELFDRLVAALGERA